jgi:NAD(P)-dependent dehydrogenase (short-subunit alcohol dehydrogenase family)
MDDGGTPVSTALVTGAAGGIGLATARVLAARGMRVAVNDVDPEAARQAAAMLGPQHLAVAADVSRENEVIEMVERVAEAFGGISVLVNNAGIADTAGPTMAQSTTSWDRLIGIHLTGAYLVSKAVAPRMAVAGGGSIVNLSSIAGLVGVPVRTAYSAAKAGVAMITRVLACEWADRPRCWADRGRPGRRRRHQAAHSARPAGRARGDRPRHRVPGLRGSLLHHRRRRPG